MSVTITFLGGTRTVTGSKYLIRHGSECVLVDCKGTNNFVCATERRYRLRLARSTPYYSRLPI